MPNVDLVKIAIVIVLLLLVVWLIGFLISLDLGSTTGTGSWWMLGEEPTTVTGARLDWSPLAVLTDLMPALFAGSAGLGLPISIVGIIGTVFTAAFVAAFVALLVKVIMRVIGA